MPKGLTPGEGTELNRVKIGGITELYGDPNIKIEKPYTILKFPGGSVEISRTPDGEYWVHVATVSDLPGEPQAVITGVNMSARNRYLVEANELIQKEIDEGSVWHVAFKVGRLP